MKPDISVSMSASMRGAKYASGSASGLFIGGFSVLEMGKVNIYSYSLPFFLVGSGREE